MKPIKFKKKLRLHKETIADLHSKEMRAAHGGLEAIDTKRCPIPITYTACMTQCPSNDSAPQICCALC
jgi:hypothetical protein